MSADIITLPIIPRVNILGAPDVFQTIDRLAKLHGADVVAKMLREKALALDYLALTGCSLRE